jgi:SOS-response transcriptional repressor LexA
MFTNTDELAEQIRAEADRLGLTVADISRMAKVSYEDVRVILVNKVRNPSFFKVCAVLRALGLEEPPPSAPYIGVVNGGSPAALCEALEELKAVNQSHDTVLHADRVPVPFHVEGGYVLMVKGQSMNRLIPDGFYVLVSPNVPPLSELDDKIIIARIGNECTCKRYNHTLKRLEPDSHDEDEQQKIIRLNEEPDFAVIGVVRQIFKNIGL